MSQAFTFTIDISADGETVQGTVAGIKGKSCGNVQKLLDQLGEELEHTHTADWDAPEPVQLGVKGGGIRIGGR